MQTRICPLFFLIGTMLANQIGYSTSLTKLEFTNLSTLASTLATRSGCIGLEACFTGCFSSLIPKRVLLQLGQDLALWSTSMWIHLYSILRIWDMSPFPKGHISTNESRSWFFLWTVVDLLKLVLSVLPPPRLQEVLVLAWRPRCLHCFGYPNHFLFEIQVECLIVQ